MKHKAKRWNGYAVCVRDYDYDDSPICAWHTGAMTFGNPMNIYETKQEAAQQAKPTSRFIVVKVTIIPSMEKGRKR